MEGFENFVKSVFKVFVIIFAVALFITAGIYYEKNKVLKKELYECKVELKIIKTYKNK